MVSYQSFNVNWRTLMKFHRQTRKRYYEDDSLGQCEARVIKIEADMIELDATVAFPEGGGQEADHGTITLKNGRALRFIDARKMYGHSPGIEGFPDVQVGGVIWHKVHPDDVPFLNELHVDDSVMVAIDTDRRARLTLSHTASHILYVAVGIVRPDAVKATLGCHIRTDGARFDFGVNERFTPEQVSQIEACANELVARDVAIAMSAHSQEPDLRSWHCEQNQIACGGTHLDRTGPVGRLVVKRKSLGSGKERLSCSFPDAVIDTVRFR